MLRRSMRGLALLICAMGLSTAPLSADEWNERTILTFSDPVIVPGATLQPGAYEFSLTDSGSARHVVQIRRADGSGPVTIVQAVPIKRLESKGDTALRFSPTDEGTPPALQAWFYPGSLYGHELVYPDAQARKIAQRSKAVVLSIDVPASDVEKGIVHTYDPSGARADWHGDPAVLKEWDAWRENAKMADSRTGDTMDRRAATAPMVTGDFQAMRVGLDELEESPNQYIGQTLSVDAEIEDIYGPRLFTIDEPRWGDLDGELLVYMPTALAALVRENDRVTITGTVKPFATADMKGEWGWEGLDPDASVELEAKPMIVADRIVGGTDDLALFVETDPERARTAGSRDAPTLDEIALLTAADDELVGRQVSLERVQVGQTASHGGFFVMDASGSSIFVLPADQKDLDIESGETVSLEGLVLQAPPALGMAGDAPSEANEQVYVLATKVRE